MLLLSLIKSSLSSFHNPPSLVYKLDEVLNVSQRMSTGKVVISCFGDVLAPEAPLSFSTVHPYFGTAWTKCQAIIAELWVKRQMQMVLMI